MPEAKDEASGISNRPRELEEEGQRRVEESAAELPDMSTVNRPRKDHPVDKDRRPPAEKE